MSTIPFARWSHSTLNTLLDGCAYQAWLDKVVKPEQQGARDHPRAAVGTAFHAAVEYAERARWRDLYAGRPVAGVTLDELMDVASDALVGCDVDWGTHDVHAAAEELGVALAHWLWGVIPDGQPGAGDSLASRVARWRPVGVEHWFTLWAPHATSRPTVGAADGVYVDEAAGELVVVDQKQARDFRRYPLDGSRNRLQAAMYARAAVEALHLPPWLTGGLPRVEFHVSRCAQGSRADFEPVRVIAVQPDESDLETLDLRAHHGDTVVWYGEVEKNPDWFLCQPEWCPHHVQAGGTCDPVAPPEFPVDVSRAPLPVW